MKRMGPILTLAAGVLLAAAVMVLNINGYAAKQRAASKQPTPTSPAHGGDHDALTPATVG